MFGFDSAVDYLFMRTGRKMYVNHMAKNFWKVAKKGESWNDYEDNQKCIGKKDAHEYLLTYTQEFLQNYKGNNRFAYAHFSVGHEPSGS